MKIYQILDAVVHVFIIISLLLASYRIRILEKEMAQMKNGYMTGIADQKRVH